MRLSTAVKSVVASAYLIAFLHACTTTRSLPSTPTAPKPATSGAVLEARNNTWLPQFTTGKWQYLIQDSSTVSISNDTTAQIEPIKSTIIYTMAIRDSNNSLLLTGHIDSQIVNSRLSKRVSNDTTKATYLHGSISREGRLKIGADEMPITCSTGSTSPMLRLTELLIVLPSHPVKVGDKWSDTASTTTCHGKIPLTQTAVREYELLDFSSCQRGAAKVRRIVTDTFLGSSAESNNHLSASGSGTATSLLCLERTTGALLSSDGKSNLELTITTIRGVFPFTQNTSTHIELR